MNKQVLDASRDKLALLENHIAGALRPVRPSQEFVQHIRNRMHFAPMPVVANRISTPRYLLLALGGVLTAALLIITGTRALFYLLGRLK
jgi:hypothetical protein